MAKINRKRNKTVIIFVSIFLILVLGVFIAQEYVESNFQSFLPDSFKEKYKLNYDEIDISAFNLSLSFENIHLQKKDSATGNSATGLDVIKCEILKISGINVLAYLSSKKIKLSKIKISAPEIWAVSPKTEKQDTTANKSSGGSKSPKSIKVDHISLENGKFKMTRHSSDSTVVSSVDDLDFELNDLRIDLSEKDTTILNYKDFEIEIGRPWMLLNQDLYKISTDKISLSSSDSSLKINSLRLTPQKPIFEFSRTLGKQTDRMEISVSKINALQMDYASMLQKRQFNIGRLIIDSLNLEAFRDKRVERLKVYKPLPSGLLRKISFPLRIDSVKLKKSYIAYGEFMEGGHEPGFIRFSDMYVSIYNITTIDSIADKLNSGISARCNLMGESTLTARIKYPLGFQEDSFVVNGNLNAMDLTALNPVLENLVFAQIRNGKANQLDFEITANNWKSTGEVKFYYENLEMELVNKKTGKPTGIIKNAGSFIANNFILEDSNPSDDEFRTGDIEFERDTIKFIFNYWWKSLQSGLIPSLGVTK